MKELSVLSMNPGTSVNRMIRPPCYIITMVFHDQSLPITDAVQKPDRV